MKDKYAVLTVTSTFRQRYVVPFSELQKLNEDVKLTDKLAVEWTADSVLAEEVNEFSQKWLGETIVDEAILTEEEILALWQKDNPNVTETDVPISSRLRQIQNWKVPEKK
jgi:hypothetical protein